MRTRKVEIDESLENALPVEDLTVWADDRLTDPADQAKKDFADSLEKQRRVIEDLLADVLKSLQKKEGQKPVSK
jgi:hypothetical protein